MAHKKGAGSSKNGRDSQSNRLGVKIYGGQEAINGNIIVRQRGTQFHLGSGVKMGKDHTIYAVVDGTVQFETKAKGRKFVSVIPPGHKVMNVAELKEAISKLSPVTPAPKPAESSEEA